MKKCVIAPIHHFYSSYRNPLPDTINLGNGYKIKKFNPNYLVYLFDFFGESFTAHDRRELENCRYAIFYYYETDEEVSNTPEYVVNEINRILIALRVVRRTRAIPTIVHYKMRGRAKEALQVIHKPLVNITFPNTIEPGDQHFTKNDSYKIRKYYRYISDLYTNFGGRYHKVLNSLFFFELGHQNHLYKPRMVNFVTSLESLFNTSHEQIAYALRTRCSYFLESDPDSRFELSNKLKQIYNLRSLFVHGQGSSRRVLNNVELQNDLLSDSEEIVRQCLQKIFDKDLIAIFGDIDRLNEEFSRLELNHNSTLN